LVAPWSALTSASAASFPNAAEIRQLGERGPIGRRRRFVNELLCSRGGTQSRRSKRSEEDLKTESLFIHSVNHLFPPVQSWGEIISLTWLCQGDFPARPTRP
jgi:hypothetical protein